MRKHAGVEAGHGADTVAAEGEDEQPGRVEDTGLRVPGVEAERGLAIGPGRDDAGMASLASYLASGPGVASASPSSSMSG